MAFSLRKCLHALLPQMVFNSALWWSIILAEFVENRRSGVRGENTMKYETIAFTEGDADFIKKKVTAVADSIVPPEEGAKDEYVLRKVTDEEGNIIAGCIMIINKCKVADLDTLWVDKKYRRQGIGSALIREAERAAKEKDCYAMTLATFDFQARPLYEKHGFTVCGTLRGWPWGHEDYIMMKRLDQPCEGYIPSKVCQYETKTADGDDAEAIEDRLGEYNNSQVPYEHGWIPLGRKITDDAGNTIAGCFAGVQGWHCAIVETVWTNEASRNHGIGSQLLREIENDAKENGAVIAITISFDWSLPFFEKNGYTVAAIREDVPRGHSCYILRKLL